MAHDDDTRGLLAAALAHDLELVLAGQDEPHEHRAFLVLRDGSRAPLQIALHLGAVLVDGGLGAAVHRTPLDPPGDSGAQALVRWGAVAACVAALAARVA